MLVKTALLVISNPKSIERVLSGIQNRVKNTLYIQLLSALSEPLSFHSNVFTSWPKYSQTIWGIYSQVARHCQGLDVRVLLSGLKYPNVMQIKTSKKVELVIFDKAHSQGDIDRFLKARIANVAQQCEVVTINNGSDEFNLNTSNEDKIYKHTVLGGTFDRLHIAHKILLTEAALRSSSKMTVGVTDENMLNNKVLLELIEPIEQRVNAVQDFITDICPELELSVEPIKDPFGPTQHDPTMDLLIVSKETVRGGEMINEVRAKKGLPILNVLPIELIEEPHRVPDEEEKISSSTTRMRLLGTLLKPPNDILPKKPYVIGLTGGIASGKSNIANTLQNFGAEVIDCDKVAHELYQPGRPCHTLIVDNFGSSVLAENGEIDRKVLGGIVFENPDQLQKLNLLIWPAIADEVVSRIKSSTANVVVIEAAILLTAGWSKYCHEIWTTVVPPNEAISRLQTRNGLSEEQASKRIASQPSNKMYVGSANVVFCSLWSFEYTRSQVQKAWSRLQGSHL